MTDQPRKIGRFEIKLELGRGAMGCVYLAHDPKIDRKVAIKTIHSGVGTSQAEANESRVRFLREAQAAGRLLHPGIVTIFDVGEEGRESYIAMEYIDGPTLEAATKPDNLMPVEKAVGFVIQAARALHFAHQHKIIHRDVKPANLMLVGDRQVKVTDFGLAKNPSADLTSAGTLIGTPTYMSPEQVMGKDLDGRSDLFSLGVVLYELLTGDKPFGGETISTIIYKILHEMPRRPDLVNPRVPPPLVKILLRTLEKDPAKRYASCEEFAKVLQAYLDVVSSGRGSRSVGQESLTPTQRLSPAAAADSRAEAARRSDANARPSRPSREGANGRKAELEFDEGPFAPPFPTVARAKPRSRAPIVLLAIVAVVGGAAGAAWLHPELLNKVGLGSVAERLGLAGMGHGAPPVEAASPEAPVPAGPPVDLPSPLPAGEVDTIPVRTEPPGGRIYLDNQEVVGGTLTLPKSDTGSHTLVAENDCFVDRATVKAGSEEPVVIPLKTPKLDPVRVVSEPPGASIFVDGRSAGARAPADINLELCQPHTIAARLDGYQTATKEFGETTDWNANSTVTLTLAVLPDGFVSVKAPYKIEVLEGGKVIGRGGAKIKLKAGRHSLRFVNGDLFVNLSASVDVSPDKTSSPGVKFPGVGGMSVHANPSNGQVSVNGRKLGPPPILDYSLAEGTYKVSYVLPSGRSDEQTILVIAGERKSVKFILK